MSDRDIALKFDDRPVIVAIILLGKFWLYISYHFYVIPSMWKCSVCIKVGCVQKYETVYYIF